MRRLCVMALATVSRNLASHRVLAVTLTARLSHRDIPCPFLEARKASPSQKREKSQDQESYCPKAMFLVLQHRVALLPFLSRPIVLVNYGCVLIFRSLKHAMVSPKGSHHLKVLSLPGVKIRAALRRQHFLLI